MRSRKAWWICWLTLLGGLVVLPGSHGQPRPSVGLPPAAPVVSPPTPPDLDRLTPLARQMYLGAQRGTDWLFRAHRQDGRFIDGYRPELNSPQAETNYLRQIGAAYALARAARKFDDERYTARARQAVLTLLMDTTLDPADQSVRQPTLPIHRLEAVGGLLLAIHEVPEPGADLLTQSDQLAAYLQRQQKNGDFREGGQPASPSAIGAALHGLVRSHAQRPAAWKLETVRKALPLCRSAWEKNKAVEAATAQSAAFAEAYLATRDRTLAAFVFDMNDWLLGQQFTRLDPEHPLWLGGFRMDNVDAVPGAGSAACAESLAAACRVARQLGDLDHYNRYRTALERCLQFLTTLQYTEANTQHFADWYRPTVLGGFYASHQDGHLRIDYTQHAVAAMLAYLDLGD